MHVFRRNKWRANNGKAGDKHINFIKPAMVDATGVPMFGRTPFMDNNSAVYNPASISFGYQPNTGTVNPTIDQGLMTTSKSALVGGNYVYYFGSVFGNDSGYTFNDDSYALNAEFFSSGATSYSYLSGGFGSNSVACYGRNSTHVQPTLAGNQYPGQVNDYLAWKNTLVGRGETTQQLEATYPWLPCATYSPAQWPDYQPCTLSGEIDDFEVDQIIGKTKVAEYMKYLANVRSLPIGVSGDILNKSYCVAATPLTAASVTNVNAPNCSFTEYRVSMPFVSGIYGILADKMFPDLLIGANNIRIEFKLASKDKALWLTMDPCRRVPGTVRDFAPFTGAANTYHRFGVVQSTQGNGCYACSDPNGFGGVTPIAASLGCTYSMLFNERATYGTTLGLNANVQFIAYSTINGSAITPGSYIYNTSSAMGEDLVATQPLVETSEAMETFLGNITASLGSGGLLNVTVVGTNFLKSGTFFVIPVTNARIEITGQETGTLGGIGTYTTSGDSSDGFASTSIQIFGDNELFMGNSNATRGGYSLSPYTNLPKPQYMPCANPWAQKDAPNTYQGATTTAAYCNESAACYGTYLPASVAQTRRTQLGSRLNISDAVFTAGTTSFAIRDLQYIGEQVQLDDISTSAIIQHAATSEIVVWTRGYRSFEANCDTGTQQNIILPIQIGQATALYLVFRPSALLSSQEYYSNSFVCPFTGLSFSSAASGIEGVTLGKANLAPHVGGKYTINSSLDTQNQGLFSYQLFSGTKQYPLQPIQTVSEMLVEREKSTHSLHNWAWCGTENMGLVGWDSGQSSATTTGFNFDPFLDLGFFTTFVPVAALDDQTITQNPYFSIAEVNDVGTAQTRVRGIRQSARSTGVVATGTTQFIGVLNTYVPPIGTFFLGWDFESWTNHDDIMRTGKFLGQEQLSIRMTGCHLMNATFPIQPQSAQAVNLNIGCTAIVPHVVKLSFVPGGHMLSYY
jgi:hypothetical protein